MQSVTSDYAFEHLHNAQLTTGTSVKSKGSSKGSSEKGNFSTFTKLIKGKAKFKTSRSAPKLSKGTSREERLQAKKIGELTKVLRG